MQLGILNWFIAFSRESNFPDNPYALQPIIENFRFKFFVLLCLLLYPLLVFPCFLLFGFNCDLDFPTLETFASASLALVELIFAAFGMVVEHWSSSPWIKNYSCFEAY